MLKKTIFITLCLLSLLVAPAISAQNAANRPDEQTEAEKKNEKDTVRKILFIGDSMTGWLAEALNGYGKQNGFDVATVVWDGSTIQKWGKSPKLTQIIEQQDPDAVFVSLGMNELFDTKPDHLKGSLNDIVKAVGDRHLLWVGPPSWNGKTQGGVLNKWLDEQLGGDKFFRSFDLKLPRQSASNVHPSRQGMIDWVDAIIDWIPEHASFGLPGYDKPAGQKMVRPKTFIYKRMKESL